MVLNRPGVFNIFSNEWKQKWIPAIIAYGHTIKRKEIQTLFSKNSSSSGINGCRSTNNILINVYIYLDNEKEEKLAFELLVSYFLSKKQSYTQAIQLVYEKCLVRMCGGICAELLRCSNHTVLLSLSMHSRGLCGQFSFCLSFCHVWKTYWNFAAINIFT